MKPTPSAPPARVSLFNIAIDNVTMAEAAAAVRSFVVSRTKTFVVTPNVDHVVKLQGDAEFLELYRKAGLVIADGMPVVWVSRWVGRPLKERVTGADLFLEVCADAAEQGFRVFLLGSASDQIIRTTAENLRARFPRLQIVGALSPSFGFENKDDETEALLRAVADAAPDLLFVGVGAPKQEKWIARNFDRIAATVSLGVGASFDFVAGSVRRAPVWMQKTGLEWFYRFLKEPRRMFQRYFVDDFVFFGLAFREWTAARRRPKP